MDLPAVDLIARTLLYEGSLLYPYRASALKNQKRWNFGILLPPAAIQTGAPSDRCSMHAECLLQGTDAATLRVAVRFLQLESDHAPARPPAFPSASPAASDVARLNRNLQAGQEEAVERSVCPSPSPLGSVRTQPVSLSFAWSGARPASGQHQPPLRGALHLSAQAVGDGLYRIALEIANQTVVPASHRDGALAYAMISTHAVLTVESGQFLSLLEPPAQFEPLAAACRNDGLWPVLVGEPGSHNVMLASPILLYDYPQVAPESPTDLFDATEIDELLTLRVLTLTEAEKREIRAGGARGRELLERVEALTAEQRQNLHGALRRP